MTMTTLAALALTAILIGRLRAAAIRERIGRHPGGAPALVRVRVDQGPRRR